MATPRPVPTASIVILARHDPRRIAGCLAALARLPDRVSREILVLLNGADNDVRAAVASPPVPVRVLHSSVNLGFAAGCNRAGAAVAGRYLVFLNDDTEVEDGWLDSLVQVADAAPDAGAVGSCVLFPDGSVQEAGSIVWQDASIMALGRGAQPESPTVSFVRDVDYCSACSLLVRRDAWTTTGGFCEDYFPAYYEDVDFCLSLRAHGYRVLYAPGSRVKHAGGGSTDPGYRRFLNDYQRRRFQARWQGALSRLEPPDPTSAAAVRRAMFRASGRVRRLLVIAGRLAGHPVGAEPVRMVDAIRELSTAGYAVSVWTPGDVQETARELGPLGVEAIAGPLDAHLCEPGVLYDTVLVSQPSLFDRFGPLIRRNQPHSALVYDADAIDHERLAGDAPVSGSAPQTARPAEAHAIRTLERTLRARADFLTCASVAAETFLRSTEGTAPVAVVSHLPRDARFGQDRYGAARSSRDRGSWVAALQHAQLSRTSRVARAATL